MTRLSVNVNKIATLRNARGGNVPDLVESVRRIEQMGAEGITVHPRPDERHIRYRDVWDLKRVVTTEFNIEGYPSRSFLDLVTAVKPAQVTLVPDPPEALTSNQGWDTIRHFDFLKEVVAEFKLHGIRVSLFTGTEEALIRRAADTGTDRVELYTEPYADQFPQNPERAVAPFTKAAQWAGECGLGLNAGHDLSLVNLKYFAQNVPGLLEVSIGHALVSDALWLGMEETIRRYLEQLR
ncbi:MAG TPA: pyridoxine 5'-phosphate synthase [Bacteroidales bacterium]|nr:pyridoxine 5'-phosphate synthase [Bacteroidales bacterium]HRZ48503.1 pyridoxine 5'-phosphate synthase [Bacteroidales bacterium]